MSAHAIVRARTSASHVEIDSAFSRFDLSNRASYEAFLQAHARVLSVIEAALSKGTSLPPWRPRAALLLADIAALGGRAPEPLAMREALGGADQFGLLYVIEGSRLGARLLARRVGPGFPSLFLSAAHDPGEWRALTQALDERAKFEDPAWLGSVVDGALYGFQLYASAASQTLGAAGSSLPT